MDIALLIPATLSLIITEVVKVLYIGIKISATLPQLIAEDTLIEVDLCYKKPANILIKIREQDFMLKGEVSISL